VGDAMHVSWEEVEPLLASAESYLEAGLPAMARLELNRAVMADPTSTGLQQALDRTATAVAAQTRFGSAA
jgi:hypothetical protein